MVHRMIRRVPLLALTATLATATPIGAEGVNVSGSVYADYFGMTDQSARQTSLSGITHEVAVKLEVDVKENLSFTAKACYGCHGLEIERAYVDFTPKSWINVQAGRIPVPFGEFALRTDPGSHRTASKPLMYEMGRMVHYGSNAFNLGVVPMPYVDTGVLAYGQTWLGQHLQVWYGAYGVAGLKGQNDVDYAAMHSIYYNDNNRAPSGGGRVVLNYSSSTPGATFRDATLGFSAMYGRYDPALKLGYTVLGVDASTRLGPVVLRGEAALRRTDIDPNAPGYRFQIIDPFIEKSGFYLEAEHPLGSRLQVVYRFDGLRRRGVPLPGSDPLLSPDSKILRYTQGLQFTLTDALYSKLEYEYWWFSDFPSFHAGHLGIGGVF
jgi:hypothetical protein